MTGAKKEAMVYGVSLMDGRSDVFHCHLELKHDFMDVTSLHIINAPGKQFRDQPS